MKKIQRFKYAVPVMIIALFFMFCGNMSSSGTNISESFSDSAVNTLGDTLVVTTGRIEQRWLMTSRGLATVHLKNLQSRTGWISEITNPTCDWDIPGLTDGPVFFESVLAGKSDDSGFTSDHLQVVVSMQYPECRTAAEYVIWLYPDAAGIRSFLRFKGLPGFSAPDSAAPDDAQIQMLHMPMAAMKRRAVSFSKHSNARAGKYQQHPMMKQTILSGTPDFSEKYPFAALMAFEKNEDALIVVKEAPEVDTPVRGTKWEGERTYAYRTGKFICETGGVRMTGAGIAASDVLTDRFRRGWAIWTIVGAAGDIALQQAVKKYDRIRYPIDPEVDIFIGANNWGSTDNPKDGRRSSFAASMLKEIDAAAEMGIKVVQIDDGWQAARWKKGDLSPRERWSLSEKAYPNGWGPVVKRAAQKDITLGFWCDGDEIPTSTLIKHVKTAGFSYVKFDFYHTSTYDQVELLREKARSLLSETGFPVRINWDITGVQSKDQGYFYGREYGNLWYQNQKQHLPDHVLYRPYRVLQDIWHLSHYVNMNQLQIPIQNVDAGYPPQTNAGRHSHTYAVAIGLLGCPNFFQELKYLTKEARREIFEILSVYKAVQPDIADGYVYPIGQKPDDRSWTGFQCHVAPRNAGYLLLFREIGNKNPREKIPLHFIRGKTVQLTDLMDTSDKRRVRVPQNGNVEFYIEKPAAISFVRYELENGDNDESP